MPCSLLSHPTLHTEPVLWGAVAAVTATHGDDRVTDVGTGVRSLIGSGFELCPTSDRSFDVRLDAFLDGALWSKHGPASGFASGGAQLEVDLIYAGGVVGGLHAGVGVGSMFLPYRTSSPWESYEAGLRVRIGDVRLGVDVFDAPAYLPSAGVRLSLGATGSTPRWVSVVGAVVTVAIASRALISTPVQ